MDFFVTVGNAVNKTDSYALVPHSVHAPDHQRY